MKYLSTENAKTSRGESLGYLTGILYLAPHNVAGGPSVCPASTAGCRASCLFYAGRGAFKSVYDARVRKTQAFHADPVAFVDGLAKDIVALQRRAKRLGLTPAVRLNGTSDIPWEIQRGSDGLTLMEKFPELQFYDYTKISLRAVLSMGPAWPANYHLTFSASEVTSKRVYLAVGSVNIAQVFDTLPEWHENRPVIDGTGHDLRFLDPPGVIVGLVPKGRAKRDVSGFVKRIA